MKLNPAKRSPGNGLNNTRYRQESPTPAVHCRESAAERVTRRPRTQKKTCRARNDLQVVKISSNSTNNLSAKSIFQTSTFTKLQLNQLVNILRRFLQELSKPQTEAEKSAAPSDGADEAADAKKLAKIPSNREVVAEELPKPDTVKNARCIFETNLMGDTSSIDAYATLRMQHVKSNPSRSVRKLVNSLKSLIQVDNLTFHLNY